MIHIHSGKIRNRIGTRVLTLCLFLLFITVGICQTETVQTVMAKNITGNSISFSKLARYSTDENVIQPIGTTNPGGQTTVTEPPVMSEEPIPIVTAEPTPVITPTPVVSATPAPVSTKAPKTFSLQLKQKGSKIRLKWKKISGAVSYQVYRAESGKKFKKFRGTKKKKILFKYSVGKKYRFKVMAFDKKHHCIGISKVSYYYIPKQPTQVHVVYQNQKTAKLTWKSVPRADYYLIYQKSGKNSAKLIRQTKKCEYINRNLTSGYTYQFQIQAVFRDGKQKFVGKAAKKSYD
ncbi:MAG: hypothetical protein K2J67_12135, partial [Lachnospiraceae bacterium]|nr:hypothetical protein [Lachnospiraceae bacterium]